MIQNDRGPPRPDSAFYKGALVACAISLVFWALVGLTIWCAVH